MKTKKDAGKLTAKMVIALGPYGGDPVVVRLDDSDSQPIALRSLLTLPPLGGSGTKWRFKSKSDGLQRVQLKSLEAKQPGMSQIVVKTKRWFTAGTWLWNLAHSSGNSCRTENSRTQPFACAACASVLRLASAALCSSAPPSRAVYRMCRITSLIVS